MASRFRLFARSLQLVVQIAILAVVGGCLDIEMPKMPVPLGDPEKSRVDPWFNGLWLGDGGVWVFEPYDRRTWLVTWYGIVEDDCAKADSSEASVSESEDEPIIEETGAVHAADEESEDADYGSLIAELRGRLSDCLSGELVGSMKVWLAKLGKATFMTFELKGAFDTETGFVPQYWLAARVIKLEHGELALNYIDPKFDGFRAPDVKAKREKLDSEEPRKAKTLAKARRAVERVIRNNVDADDLYYGEDPFFSLFRIQPQDYDIFVDDIVPSP